MSKELPEDVTANIFSRVPVGDILRFKSVSKSMYALFQNPNFIAKHFQIQTTNSGLTVLDASFVFTFDKSSFKPTAVINIELIPLDSENSIKIPLEINIPILSLVNELSVCGSCHGLICLSILPISSVILLWNPATRVLKDLPVSPVRTRPINVVLAFGFDDVANDYKVLRIVYFDRKLNQVEIYSLETNSWRVIKTHLGFTIESTRNVFLKGKFYWTGVKSEEVQWKSLIVSFDFREEGFNHMMPPEFDFGREDFSLLTLSWTLVALKESLAVIGSTESQSGMRFEIWVMIENGVVRSWMKYTSFELQMKVCRPLGCGLKGEILLEKDDSQLVLYDFESEMIKNLGHHRGAKWSNVFNHVGSLLPIKGGKVAQRADFLDVGPAYIVP